MACSTPHKKGPYGGRSGGQVKTEILHKWVEIEASGATPEMPLPKVGVARNLDAEF